MGALMSRFTTKNEPNKTAQNDPKKGSKDRVGIAARLKNMVRWPTFYKKKEPKKTPVGIAGRVKNIASNNFRGIFGVIPPLALLTWQAEKGNNAKTVELMWMWMFWFIMTQPVSIPATGLIPIFLLPMSGAMSTIHTCNCYMNENIILYILTGMLICLLNNSGVDRRIALWFLCSGDSCQYSGKRMVLKCSAAAYFLSMFSSRLISASIITQYIASALTKLQSTVGKSNEDPDFVGMRYILCNAIQTSSSIGSTAILHSSYVTILFKAIWAESPPRSKEYADIFNYLQYSAFAFPVSFIMFVLNFSYHMLLVNWILGKAMTTASMIELKNILSQSKAELPRRVSLHEKLSVLFALIYLLMFFLRWNQWIEGWSLYRADTISPDIPRVKDATVAAVFLILLHILPKGYGFLKFFDAEKRSELPPLKPESSILWWRFVDKNINYGYFFSFGAGIALVTSARETGLATIISENFGRVFTGKPWNGGIFLVCFITMVLCNTTTAVACCMIFLPLVMSMARDAPDPWPAKVYCAALGVGIASSLGFCCPFKYTPAYYCYHVGKVPIRQMIKYSFWSAWICLIILWAALLSWAPFLFDPEDHGIFPLQGPLQPGGTIPPSTLSPEGGGDGGL